MDAERLRTLLDYDPATGVFYWHQGQRCGQRAGALCRGRWYVNLDGRNGKRYLMARLAWLWAYSSWPVAQVDHINGNPADDRLTNLRQATNAQNGCNRKTHSKHGYKGVWWRAKTGKWAARITSQGKNYHLGYFSTLEDAVAARAAKAAELHGAFARAA